MPMSADELQRCVDRTALTLSVLSPEQRVQAFHAAYEHALAKNPGMTEDAAVGGRLRGQDHRADRRVRTDGRQRMSLELIIPPAAVPISLTEIQGAVPRRPSRTRMRCSPATSAVGDRPRSRRTTAWR